MKVIPFLIILTITISSNGQTNNPFLSLEFDKITMYDFEGGKGSDLTIIDDKGQLAKSVIKKIDMGKGEITKLNQMLGSRKSYGGATASCFDPHLGSFCNKRQGGVSGIPWSAVRWQ